MDHTLKDPGEDPGPPLPLFSALAADVPLADERVAEYLDRNRDFFVARAELLERMTPPPRWSRGPVIDLQHRWVDILKGELAGLRDCATSVIETSRANLDIQIRTHVAVLALLQAGGLAELVDVVTRDLPVVLAVDAVRLVLDSDAADGLALPASIPVLEANGVDGLLGAEKDVALLPEVAPEAARRLFGAGSGVQSAALVRLDLGSRDGAALLAFGAGTAGVFSPRQGVELLRFLAEVVSHCLRSQLPARP
jgi:hypothetical protein